jgi:hypothetical protein
MHDRTRANMRTTDDETNCEEAHGGQQEARDSSVLCACCISNAAAHAHRTLECWSRAHSPTRVECEDSPAREESARLDPHEHSRCANVASTRMYVYYTNIRLMPHIRYCAYRCESSRTRA